MQISIANAILVARLVGKSIVKLGLKMWLRFNKSNILGCELVINGDFATDTDWTKQAGWTISGGAANFDGINSVYISQAGAFAPNKTNKITFIIENNTSGSFSVRDGVAATLIPNTVYTNGTHSFDIEVGSNSTIRIYGVAGSGSLSISSFSVKEVAQFVPDDSNNCNECKLFTGKALSFDGTGDFIDLGDVGVSLKTICFWINLYSTSEKVLELSSTHSVEVSSGIVVLNGTWDNSVVYVNNSATTDITNTIWQRVVITTTTAITVNDFQLGRINAVRANGQFIVSDLQLFNSTWTTSDVAFDYNNPNHLVTDNPNTTLTLSNLSSYYALSEGSGSAVYDSSGEGNNGTITGATYDDQQTTIPQFGMMDWSKGSNLYLNSEPTSNESAAQNITYASYSWNYIGFKNATVFGDNSSLRYRYGSSVTSGLEYTLSAFVIMDDNSEPDITNTTSSGDFGIVLGNDVSGGTNTKTNVSGNIWRVSKTKTVTSTTTNNGIIKYITQSTKGFKVVGWQLEESSTVGSYIGTNGLAASNATLVQNPNNKGFDILGNPLRLREHSFNLDGSGYGEVADANSLDFGAGDFTVEVWVKASYLSGGSTLNSIISLGGAMTDINTVSIGVYSATSKFAVYVASLVMYSTNAFVSGKWYHVLVTRDSGSCTMYVDSVVQATVSRNNSITNSLVKYIGRDSRTDRFYSNLIGEPRIYDRYLTQKEVTQNYNVGLPSHSNDSSYSDDYSSDYGF